MNSEELELSLRTEFDSHLKDVLAAIARDVADFQKNIGAEFEKHKSQIDAAISSLSSKIEQGPAADPAFNQSVVEHLRLARDEGAQLAATAFGEAEKLREESEPVVAAKYDLIRDAVNDISSKTSQASILKSLVEHAEHFTPRGAFFIVKNDQFVGWKVFGAGAHKDDAEVREINFPLTSNTILSASITAMATSEGAFGSHADDAAFLNPLDFGQPDRMYAVPLTARGRGVAVLYADYGSGGATLNIEALEMLVRVAGLTVELLAAAQQVQPEQQTQSYAPHVPAPAYEAPPVREYTPEFEQPSDDYAAPARAENEAAEIEQPEQVEEYSGVVSFEEEPQAEQPASYAMEPEPVQAEEAPQLEYSSGAQETQEYTTQDFRTEDYGTIETNAYQPAETVEPSYAPAETEYAFSSNETYDAEPTAVETADDFVVQHEEVSVSTNGKSAEHMVVAEPVVEVAGAQPVKSRFSDRNVDLPIQVGDDERRLHNDARRFARLLVSEIKLYNEQKVNEGRESSDLYDRLREAIDRSREMYDKRVQPAVASKFDYFHYELVNSLAEGEPVKLGASYPGANV